MSSGTDKSSEHSTNLSGTVTPRTQTTNDTAISVSHSPKESRQFLSNSILLEHFTKIFFHLRRAVVRYTLLLNILFITKCCITILITFYIKNPTLQKLQKNFSGEKAMSARLLQNVQVQCMKCQTYHLS